MVRLSWALVLFSFGLAAGVLLCKWAQKEVACAAACVEAGSTKYRQSGDLCVCTNMVVMRQRPASSMFVGTQQRTWR